MFMPEEPDVVVPAVPVIIVSATVIPSVAVVMFIVGVLPVALLSLCPPSPHPDRRHRRLACCCRCCRRVHSSLPCPLLPSLVAVVVVDVSARAVSLATVIVLSLHQRSSACSDAHEIPVCKWGSPLSPYAYGDRSLSPYAYGDCMSCNPRMHTGIYVIPICIRGLILIPVCIWELQGVIGSHHGEPLCLFLEEVTIIMSTTNKRWK